MAVTTDRSGVISIVSNGLWSNYALGGSCYVLSGSLDTTLNVNCYGAASVSLTGEVSQ